MTARRRLSGRSWLALAMATCGCDPTVFDSLRDDAPVIVLSAPAGARVGAFGSVLTSYDLPVDGARGSRLVVAGGALVEPGSSYRAYPMFDALDGDEGVLRAGELSIFAGCDAGDCSDGHGASVAAFPEWVAADGSVFHGCVAAPSLSTGNVNVRCEDLQPMFQTIAGPADEAFGASAAGISSAQHPVGVALFGAPGADEGNGALYRLPLGGGAPVRIDLSRAMAPAEGAIGSSVAVAPISPRAVMFATRAIDAAGDRVIVGTLETDADTVVVVIRGCIAGPTGFGAALALGDLDGDDAPDLAIGTSSDAAQQGIRVYDGAALAAATTTCGEEPLEPAATLTCSDLADEDVPCADGERIGLGASLAIGDVDGDGIGDLIAGAPEASPMGEASAGAVFALAGESGSLARIGATHASIFHSAQEPGDQLGRSVAVIAGVGRAEIAAGAPAAREVAIFLCSGLPEDRPTEGRVRGCVGP